jgi:hypothetical protein
VATATAFTANTLAGGPYNLAATATGLTTVNFSLTNTTGAASNMTPNAGTTPQSAPVNTAFGIALAVTATDANSNSISGVSVTFTPPAQTGASGLFANNTGTTQATTGANGVATATTFTANAHGGGPYNVVATASGLTAVNFALTNSMVLNAVSVTPNSGSGVGPTTFNALYTDSAGASDLQSVYLDFGAASFATHDCIAVYVPGANQLYLFSDTNTSLGPITLGSGGGTLSNSQCTLSSGSTGATFAGNNLSVPFNITFKTGYGGLKQEFILAESSNGTFSGAGAPTDAGTWTPASSTPRAVSVNPPSGSGVGPTTFNAVYSDTGGANDLDIVYLDFGSVGTASTINPAAENNCIVLYTPASNNLYLFTDNNSTAVGPIKLGSGGGTLSNSQCTLSSGTQAATLSGDNLTVPFSITFKAGYGGLKQIFGLAITYNGTSSNGGLWLPIGTWTPAASTPSVVSVAPINGSGAGTPASPLVFTAKFSNTGGANDLRVVYLTFGPSLNAAHSCAVGFQAGNNSLELFSDDGASAATVGEGLGGSVSNSQCTLYGGSTAATLSGTTLTVPFSIVFKPGFTGSQTALGLAQTYAGTFSNGGTPTNLGSWTP